MNLIRLHNGKIFYFQVTPTNDLISHEIVNISNGFLVPNSALLSDSYSKEDNLLIKVVMIL